MKEYSLPRDRLSPLEFCGELVAEVSSDPLKLGARWTELRLFATQGGNFVVQSLGMSKIPGEYNRSNVSVAKTLDEAASLFVRQGKVTWLSKKMFSAIGERYPHFTPPAERIA